MDETMLLVHARQSTVCARHNLLTNQISEPVAMTLFVYLMVEIVTVFFFQDIFFNF